MRKRSRVNSLGEEPTTPTAERPVEGSSSNFSIVPVEVIARILEFLMSAHWLSRSPTRLVGKKWDRGVLCLLEAVLGQRLTETGEWKLTPHLTLIDKHIIRSLSRMTVEVVSSIKVLNLVGLETSMHRRETFDEILEYFSVPFSANSSQLVQGRIIDEPETKLNVSIALDVASCQPPRLLRTLKSMSSTLAGLHLNCHSSADEDFVKEIVRLDGLKELAFVRCIGLTPRSLKEVIAKLPQLRSLDLTGSLSRGTWDEPTLGSAFLHLASLQSLEKLDLSHADIVTDDQISALVGALDNLRTLKLGSCQSLTDKCFQSIAKLTPHFETLSIVACRGVTDSALEALSCVSTLTDLDLSSFVQVTNNGIRHLAKLTNLKSLDISGCPSLNDAGIAALSPLVSLENFRAGYTMLGDAGLQKLVVSSPGITALDLRSCRSISDLGLASLSKLTKLKDLNLSDNAFITDASARILAALPNLTALNLCYCRDITNEAVRALSESATLQQLNLDRCRVSNVTPLAKLRTLKSLSVAHTTIRDDCMAALAMLPNLETLDISECNYVTDLGFLEIHGMKSLMCLIHRGIFE